MFNIRIQTIPHEKQRYNTCGDYIIDDNGDVTIYVSETGNWKYDFLIALHEMVEYALCKDHDVPVYVIDDFDISFEQNRLPGDESKPGDSLKAPYRKEHFVASTMERIAANELSLFWEHYQTVISRLYEKSPK